MHKIDLTAKDYKTIKAKANSIYLDSNPTRVGLTNDDFLAYCYTQAFISYLTSNGWYVENGSIYTK